MADLKAIRHILANCNREDVTPRSLEDFVLMVFEHNKVYEEKKHKNIPGMDGCLIILPDNYKDYKELMDLCWPVPIKNAKHDDMNFYYDNERATVARPRHLDRNHSKELNKFEKVYIFKHDLKSLFNFYDTCKSESLFEKFDNFHLVYCQTLN